MEDSNAYTGAEETGRSPYEDLRTMLLDQPNINLNITISKKDLIIRILKHAIVYRTSKQELLSLLVLLKNVFHFSLFPETSYYIDKLFNPNLDLSYHAICPKCKVYIGTFDKGQTHIPCDKCNQRINLIEENFFVLIDPSSEISLLLKKNASYYKHVVEHRKHVQNNLEDIIDGIMYRKFVKSLPPDQRKRYVTCVLNSDGVPRMNLLTHLYGQYG